LNWVVAAGNTPDQFMELIRLAPLTASSTVYEMAMQR